MTDKVANGSVEDVLSSIKRLVGEEGRKIPDLVPTSLARRPGRLVLTDALRVSETPEDSEQSPKTYNFNPEFNQVYQCKKRKI